MELQLGFFRGRMNKDMDERFLREGEYPHAENIRVSNSGEKNVGIIENYLGNRKLTDIDLEDAQVIGAFPDESNRLLYFFVTSPTKDILVEFNELTSETEIVLESSVPGTLNLNKLKPVYHINKIINDDSSKDLLYWTDGFNPPRRVNIQRAKTYGLDGFTEDDISVILRPPLFAPTYQLIQDPSESTNLKERFLCFAYRYKYLDGEYSVLSPFSSYAFAPEGFDLDYQTYENLGMVNAFNKVRLSFDTGSERVTDIQLVFKESNSPTVYLVETLNKELNNLDDNVISTFDFKDNKIYSVLPEKEYFTRFHAVPLTAQAQEYAANRIMYANIKEGFDLVDAEGEPIKIDYTVGYNSYNIFGQQLPVSFVSTTMSIDLSDIELVRGKRISFNFDLTSALNGRASVITDFILNDDYDTVADLISSQDFTDFILFITSRFETTYSLDVPPNTSVSLAGNFTVSSLGNVITITAPILLLVEDTTPDVPDDPENDEETLVPFSFSTTSSAFFKDNAVDSSMKTDRSYEVSVEYIDEHGRGTPALTSQDNTIYIPVSQSTSQNKLTVELNHRPPADAKFFRFAVKQNKLDYQTIYTSLFYEDGLYRWIKLEGENKKKINEDDTLIVKSDLSRPLETLTKVKVLEKTNQVRDFIPNNELNTGEPLIEAAGTYIKVKPVGFDMNIQGDAFKRFEGFLKRRYASRSRVYTQPLFGWLDAQNVFNPYPINAGTQVRIYLESKMLGQASFFESFERDYIVQEDYNSVQDWFNAEVGDIEPFATNRLAEWGFDPDGSRFFVRSNRDGTASRDVWITVRFDILFSSGTLIFETEPKDSNLDVFYQTSQTFPIVNGNHTGNVQNQDHDLGTPAQFELDTFNCFVMGNGAESNRIKDNFIANSLLIDFKPITTSVERFKQITRFTDIIYTEPYNENSGINGLNDISLYAVPFKDDIEKRWGRVKKLYARDGDIVVFQEDKVSAVLVGKDEITKADGSTDLITIPEVLGRQIPIPGEWGLSDPATFAFRGNSMIFLDTKRSVPVRFGGNGLYEINQGMTNFFRDYISGPYTYRAIGAFDNFYDVYTLSIMKYDLEGNQVDHITLTFDGESPQPEMNGWTSFHSYKPEWMVSLNNKFFTFKAGELYQHHVEEYARNVYYNVFSPSKVSAIFGQSSTEIKNFKTLALYGNSTWRATLKAFRDSSSDFAISTLYENDFIKKEGVRRAYIRRNEDSNDFSSKSTYGLGRVADIVGNTITFTAALSSIVSVGDDIYKGTDLVGKIISRTPNSVTLNNVLAVINPADFLFGKKNGRIAGGALRGYALRVDMENHNQFKAELSSISTEVFKSNP
jgi:hypothetical protein